MRDGMNEGPEPKAQRTNKTERWCVWTPEDDETAVLEADFTSLEEAETYRQEGCGLHSYISKEQVK